MYHNSSQGSGFIAVNNNIGQTGGNPFFDFSKPYLDIIGKEKIFSFVYYVMAVLNLLLPVVIMVAVIYSGFPSGKLGVAFGFSWLVVTFACWISFQLWWDRRTKISDTADTQFVATVAFSSILQTVGEWVGTFIGIVGAGVGLVATVLLGSHSAIIFEMIGMDFLSAMGPGVIIVGPVTGFFIIVIFRFLAEQLLVFASIANNTGKIAVNVGKVDTRGNNLQSADY
jgi:hypothetical protein